MTSQTLAATHYLACESLLKREWYKDALEQISAAILCDDKTAVYFRVRALIWKIFHNKNETARDYDQKYGLSAADDLANYMALSGGSDAIMLFTSFCVQQEYWEKILDAIPQERIVPKNKQGQIPEHVWFVLAFTRALAAVRNKQPEPELMEEMVKHCKETESGRQKDHQRALGALTRLKAAYTESEAHVSDANRFVSDSWGEITRRLIPEE